MPVNNALQIPVDTSGIQYNGVVSAGNYDLTSSDCFVQLVSAGDQSISLSADFMLWTGSSAYGLDFQVSNGVLYANTTDNYLNTEIDDAVYDPVNHAWLKISESGGTVTFWTAPDGITWTPFATIADADVPGTDLTDLTVQFMGSANTGPLAAPTFVVFDNFNTVPVYPAVAAGAASFPGVTLNIGGAVVPDAVAATATFPAPAIDTNQPLSTITDSFPGSSLSYLWNPFGNAVTIQDNTLILTSSAGSQNYNGVASASAYNLTDSSIIVQIVDAGTQQPGFATDLLLFTGAAAYGLDFQIANGTISANYVNNNVTTALGATGYTSGVHNWLQIAESGGTITFSFSADGVSYLVIGTVSDTDVAGFMNISAVNVQLQVSGTVAGTNTWANVNLPAQIVTPATVEGFAAFPRYPVPWPVVAVTSFPAATVNEGVVITPAVVAATTALSATPDAGEQTTTTVVAAATSFPAATVNASAAITTVDVQAPAVFPAPSLEADQYLTTSVVSSGISFPAPAIRADSYITTAVVAATSTLSAPVTITGIIVPQAVGAVTTLDPGTENAGSVITPAVVACTGAIPAVALQLSEGATAPAVVACSGTFPALTVSAGEGTTTTVLAATTSFGTDTPNAGSVVTTSTVTNGISFFTPTVRGDVTVTTTAITGSAAFPAAAIRADVIFTPGVPVQASATFYSPLIRFDASVTTTVVSAVTTFPATAPGAGASIVAGPVIAATSFFTPAMATGWNLTTSLVAATTAFGTDIVNAGLTTFPSVVTATTTFPALTLTAGYIVTPAVVTGTTAFYQPVISENASITTTVITCYALLEAIAQTVFEVPPTLAGSAAITSALYGTAKVQT